ncbi:MAG: hypothetical protein WAU65_03250 [Candidatus Nanoarchaeia archaeon]
MSLESKVGNGSKFKRIIYAAAIGLSLATTGCPVGYTGIFYSNYRSFRLERPHYSAPIFLERRFRFDHPSRR